MVSAGLSHARAHAIRRAGIAAAALGSAIGAHMIAMGSWDALPIAPAIWAMLIAGAALIGTRNRVFCCRGIPATVALVLASQVVCHMAMAAAPWAFGLQAHHDVPLISLGAASAHIVAGAVLIVGVIWLERILALATRVVRAVITLVARVRATARRHGRSAHRRALPGRLRIPRVAFLAISPARGPPLAA